MKVRGKGGGGDKRHKLRCAAAPLVVTRGTAPLIDSPIYWGAVSYFCREKGPKIL